jgi:hypothetical protein
MAMINEFAGGQLVRQTYWRDQEGNAATWADDVTDEEYNAPPPS